MQTRRSVTALLFCVSAFAGAARAIDAESDRWLSLRRFMGDWTGIASGQASDGFVMRMYSFIMAERFVQEINTTRYPPQEKNKGGEVHEHWGVFSYDKARKLVVLRQFHAEGFVNTYRLADSLEGTGSLVFDSEAFENFSNSWKARESYEFMSDDEFVEPFELAAPGKPFRVYSRNHFKRVAR